MIRHAPPPTGKLASEIRHKRYDHLRDYYAKLYGDLQLVRVELNNLEAEMLELGEIEEGDIA